MAKPKRSTRKVIEQPADLAARLNRNQNQPDPDPSGGSQNAVFAGIEVQNLTPRLRTEANVPSNVNGVIVTRVDPSSPIAQAAQARRRHRTD